MSPHLSLLGPNGYNFTGEIHRNEIQGLKLVPQGGIQWNLDNNRTFNDAKNLAKVKYLSQGRSSKMSDVSCIVGAMGWGRQEILVHS